jgi:hypothetical protein
VTTASSQLANTAQDLPLVGNGRIVLPPGHLRPMAVQREDGVQRWIDYATHPAYSELVARAGIADTLASLKIFARNFSLILSKRLISYELIPGHLRKPRSAGGALRLLRRAGLHALQKLLPRRSRTTDAGALVADRLREDGICVLQIDAAQFMQLQAIAQPQYDALRQRRGDKRVGGREFDESRASAKRTSETALFSQVESILTDSGALDGVSSYLGRPASLVDVNPQINDRSDDFWRRIFPDLPPADRPARYMHRDASGGDIKAIFYMSDVGPDNGPFCYVLGSHRTRSSTIADWVEEANDQGPLSATGLASRKHFAALPRALQRKCSFGNDVLPDTDIARRLLGSEWTITSPRGHVVLFDTKGLHRGGLVDQDERIVMTCVMG